MCYVNHPKIRARSRTTDREPNGGFSADTSCTDEAVLGMRVLGDVSSACPPAADMFLLGTAMLEIERMGDVARVAG